MRLGWIVVAASALLMLSVAQGGAKGDDKVKSTKAATAAQEQAFEANAAKLGPLVEYKAKLIVDAGALCQGKFEPEGGVVSLAKTFFKDNGQEPEGIIIEEGYLNNGATVQILIVWQELLRVCGGHLRQPPPVGLAAGDPDCKGTLEKAHKLMNSAMDAAQDAQNRAHAKNLPVPPGVNPAAWQKELMEYCAGARAAYNDVKGKKAAMKTMLAGMKGLNVDAPPAAPTPEQQYLLDGYGRMCRAETLAKKALAAAGK